MFDAAFLKLTGGHVFRNKATQTVLDSFSFSINKITGKIRFVAT
jgi:hypothetical protein